MDCGYKNPHDEAIRCWELKNRIIYYTNFDFDQCFYLVKKNWDNGTIGGIQYQLLEFLREYRKETVKNSIIPFLNYEIPKVLVEVIYTLHPPELLRYALDVINCYLDLSDDKINRMMIENNLVVGITRIIKSDSEFFLNALLCFHFLVNIEWDYVNMYIDEVFLDNAFIYLSNHDPDQCLCVFKFLVDIKPHIKNEKICFLIFKISLRLFIYHFHKESLDAITHVVILYGDNNSAFIEYLPDDIINSLDSFFLQSEDPFVISCLLFLFSEIYEVKQFDHISQLINIVLRFDSGGNNQILALYCIGILIPKQRCLIDIIKTSGLIGYVISNINDSVLSLKLESIMFLSICIQYGDNEIMSIVEENGIISLLIDSYGAFDSKSKLFIAHAIEAYLRSNIVDFFDKQSTFIEEIEQIFFENQIEFSFEQNLTNT